MNKFFIIVGREYKAIVGSKSFIVMTILCPFIMALCVAVPIIIGMINDQASEQQTVTVIDQSAAHYGKALKDHDQYRYVQLTASASERVNARQFYDKSQGQMTAVVVIPATIDSTLEVAVYSDNTISNALKTDIAHAMSDTLTKARIASYGIPQLQKIVDEADAQVDVQSIKWGDEGEESSSSTEAAMVLGLVLSLLIYAFVISYGAMVMNSVIEEKTNRIVEVMVSSCKPFQMMMGKITGVGLVGITQFAIWSVMMSVLGSIAAAVLGISLGAGDIASVTGAQAMIQNPEATDAATAIMQAVLSINYLPIILCFVVYFLGGYLLYASLFCAFGSAVDQASDASQFMTPIMVIMVLALYAGMACVDNPNGPMAVWCSMIPFTSPVVMMVRLPYDVPAWQLATSFALLYATAAALVWLSGRIYRTGILLYGKKRSFVEIMKWVVRR